MVELFVNPDAGPRAGGKQVVANEQPQRRRWVRLEIFSPVILHQLIIDEAGQSVKRSGHEKSAMILNISGGGVLLSTFDSLSEGDYLLMKFEIKGFDALADVLGKAKRVEHCPDGENLIGIEFLTPSNLDEDWLSNQLKGMVEDPLGFSERLHSLVSRYVFRHQVADAAME